jgi:LysM repeat protein
MSRGAEQRRRAVHYGAPVLFLALVTVVVLLIRSGFESGAAPASTTAPTTTTATAQKAADHRRAKPNGARYYTVQTGDTFGVISARTGVPVAELERLNPGVSSNALQIGQKLRVK